MRRDQAHQCGAGLFSSIRRRAGKGEGRRAKGEGRGARGEGRGERGEGRRERGEGRREKGEGRREKGEGRREKGEGRREKKEKGEGRREKGEGRREKGEGRREKGEGRREKTFTLRNARFCGRNWASRSATVLVRRQVTRGDDSEIPDGPRPAGQPLNYARERPTRTKSTEPNDRQKPWKQCCDTTQWRSVARHARNTPSYCV